MWNVYKINYIFRHLKIYYKPHVYQIIFFAIINVLLINYSIYNSLFTQCD